MGNTVKSAISVLFLVAGVCLNAHAQQQNEVVSKYGKANGNFIGAVAVKMYTDAKTGLNCSVGSVSFEAGARSKWHKHPGGQMLMVTEGKGFYQERGKPKKVILKGDFISCLPNVEHWHGAADDSSMTHVAIGPNVDQGAVTWLEHVTDAVYLQK